MQKNLEFETWAKDHIDKLYESWLKQTNSEIEWTRYYWTLRKAFEAGQEYEKRNN